MKSICQLFLLLLLLPSKVICEEIYYQEFSPTIIKSTTNRDEPNNGDYFIANDFALGFSSLGILTDIDYRTEYHRPHTPSPKLSIYMRGYTKFYPPFDKGTNVLYVYYPMAFDKNSSKKTKKSILNNRPSQPQSSSLDDDFNNFDFIAVASPTYTKTLQQNGINAIYIPQFTNPQKFYPNPQKHLQTDILFVGSNWHDRTSLRYAIEQGFNVSVYGYNWEGLIPSSMYKAPYISNSILNQYYSSAKIVLNDHRPDMKELGFINNRIFDATASGALVISDYMEEIKDIYGDCIPMYKSKEELKTLLNYYLQNDTLRQQLAQCAQEITLKSFTHTAVSQKLLTYLRNISKQKR